MQGFQVELQHIQQQQALEDARHHLLKSKILHQAELHRLAVECEVQMAQVVHPKVMTGQTTQRSPLPALLAMIRDDDCKMEEHAGSSFLPLQMSLQVRGSTACVVSIRHTGEFLSF